MFLLFGSCAEDETIARCLPVSFVQKVLEQAEDELLCGEICIPIGPQGFDPFTVYI